MISSNIFKSDLYRIHNIVQSSMTLRPKELIISTLKDFFSKDSFYHYVTDPWGFPLTPDHTDLPLGAGISDKSTTRLFIGESYRQDVIYYPAIVVRSGSMRSVPVSFSRERYSVQWDHLVFEDGYGNIKTFKSPKHFIFAGAWEGTVNVDILTKDIRSRDDLGDLVSILFTDLAFDALIKEGLIVTGVSLSDGQETSDRNDFVYKTTASLSIRTEWRRHVPISNIIEIINTSIEFGRIPEGPIAPNLTINTQMDLSDILAEL